jgi:hypothetical protein
VLGVLLPNARWKRRGFAGRAVFGFLIAFVVAVIGGFSFLIAVGSLVTAFGSSLLTGGSVGGSVAAALAKELEILISFVILFAATWGTEFGFLRATFRTLVEHLQLGAPPPRPTSSTAEARIALVEGAQWGNITLYATEDPFLGAGWVTEGVWSIAIKLDPAHPARQLARVPPPPGSFVDIDPVELHQRIRERLCTLNDAALPVNKRISGLSVTDRLIGSGRLRWSSPLVDNALMTPYSQASPEAIQALIRHPQSGVRYFQQVSVCDEGPPVFSGDRQVLEGADMGISASAFIYAAVEGRMFYLQFVLTAMPPVDVDYQDIDTLPSISSGKFWFAMLQYSLKSLFRVTAYAPVGVYRAFRLWLHERRNERDSLKHDGSAVGELGALISVRELGSHRDLGSYINDLDVEKYQKIIQRLLLETVKDFLVEKGVDISAFEDSANVINGDVSIATITGNNNRVGGRNTTINRPARSRD